MQQVLFHLPSGLPWVGGMPIYGYGVMLVVGFFAALQLAKYLARRSGIDPEIFVNAGLIALVAGVIGARLSHVLENFSYYTNPHRTAWENLKDAANLRSGGLTFYGGFLLATPCTIAYGWLKKVPIRLGMDIVAPCLMIGLGFGRIGCFLNGCCYGAECDLPAPLSVAYPYHSNPYLDQFRKGEVNPPRELLGRLSDGEAAPLPPDDFKGNPTLQAEAAEQHSKALLPAQLFSTITAWLIAGVLVAYFTLGPIPGRVFALMLLIEATSRFILEMLRAEPPVVGKGSDPPLFTSLPPMSFSMVLSVFLLIAGILLWFAFGRYGRRNGDAAAQLRAAPSPA